MFYRTVKPNIWISILYFNPILRSTYPTYFLFCLRFKVYKVDKWIVLRVKWELDNSFKIKCTWLEILRNPQLLETSKSKFLSIVFFVLERFINFTKYFFFFFLSWKRGRCKIIKNNHNNTALLERQRQSVHGLSLYCLCACALILPIQQSVAFNSRSRRARQSVATSRVHGGARNAGGPPSDSRLLSEPDVRPQRNMTFITFTAQ